MVPTQFINVLCTKQICLAPGCRSFNSAKIKFHAFVPNAAWKCSCLTPSVLHLVSYSAVHINCLSFSCLFINSTLPETHLLLPSYPFPLLLQLWQHCIPGPPVRKTAIPSCKYFLISKRISITQLGHSRPFSDIVYFIWQFSNHWGHKLTQNSAFREGQSCVASLALYRLKYQIMCCKKVLAVNYSETEAVGNFLFA